MAQSLYPCSLSPSILITSRACWDHVPMIPCGALVKVPNWPVSQCFKNGHG